MKNLKQYESFGNEEKVTEANEVPKEGLLVFVYKSGHGDSTAGGLTSKVDQVRLVGEGIKGPFPPKDDEDYLVLMKKKAAYNDGDYLYAVPKSVLDAGESPMMGGNFVYSSDSRFRAVAKYPIPVHDRVEKSR